MITFLAFLLTIAGCINWLMIGLLQYDFIAGFFGFQASIFSRLIYILFGIASLYLIIRIIANRGSFKIYEKKKKQANNTTSPQPTEQSSQIATNSEKSVTEQTYYHSDDLKQK